MNPYRILVTFNGSQTGLDCHEFVAGTTAMLSDDLAAVALWSRWVEAELPEDAVTPDTAPLAANRETKVVEVAETKPAAPVNTSKKPIGKK